MKTLKAATLAMMTALFLFAAGSASAADKQHFGASIDPKAPKVTLAQLLAKPGAYAGKMVVVDGTHSGACADGEDFYFKDKFDMIEATPPSPEVMQLKKGTRVRLYGIVKVRHSGAAEAGEKGEKKEAGETEMHIIAKGVEVQ